MTSVQKIVTAIETFCTNHYQVQKFGADFLEQLPNFATQDEKYPVVFVVPTGSIEGEIVKTLTFDIYCLDIIQKGRENIITILSDTELILDDLFLNLATGDDWTYDVTSATKTPLNNDLLDYCAGWVMSIDIQGQIHCETEIPSA